MCDTFVAAPDKTESGSMILAKNSDREPNEAQNVTFIPAAVHEKGSMVSCTYIEIPQVRETYAALVSRPFWMFGAEMGINERGVAIGNEAVFTREKYEKGNRNLTGMDMLRLALERSKSAGDAAGIITELLEKYRQGGNCGYLKKLYYHNSFLIADSENAYILETAGKHWALKRVNGIASISNCLTIEEDYEESSKDFTGLNFRKTFSDGIITYFAKGKRRIECSLGGLSRWSGRITGKEMMAILRDHNSDNVFHPWKRSMEGICLHSGGIISTQSTGSMVAVMKKGAPPLVYFTGTSAPCLGIFKPFILHNGSMQVYENRFTAEGDNGTLEIFGKGKGSYSGSSLWWRGEDIHRRVLFNYKEFAPGWQSEVFRLEDECVKNLENKLGGEDPGSLEKSAGMKTAECINRQTDMADRIGGLFNRQEMGKGIPFLFKRHWAKMNRIAGFNY